MNTAQCQAAAIALKRAIAQFMRDGDYMRHLRRSKRLYSARNQALQRRWNAKAIASISASWPSSCHCPTVSWISTCFKAPWAAAWRLFRLRPA
ncbi:MAG: hypothetical protein ACTHNE_00830 [Dyella sp.]